MTMVGYQYGGMRTYTDNDVDRLYEAETARMIEEAFGGVDIAGHTFEAIQDINVAIRKMKEARNWLGNAINERVSEELEDKIASYYDKMDDLIASLSHDVEGW